MKIPENVNVEIDGLIVKVKGPKGETQRQFKAIGLEIKKEGDEIKVITDDIALKGTVESVINNLFKGVTEGFTKKFKMLYAHFPFTIEVRGKDVIIKNFLGERSERKTKIFGDVKVSVKGQILEVTGVNKEEVGQTAANIKQVLKIRNKDDRIFQDGIYEI